MKPSLLVTVTGVAALVLVLGALADDPARAQPAPSPLFLREYQAGIDSYRLGKYDDAHAHLEKAKVIEPKLPGPHRWLAAVDQAEEKWADCVAHAREAVKLNPQSQEIEATRQLHEACRKSAGRPEFSGDYAGGGALAISCNVVGASIALNGLMSGAIPQPPRGLAVGAVEVTAAKKGFLSKKVDAEVLPGIVTDVDIVLEPDPAAQAKATIEEQPAMPTTGWFQLSGMPGAVAVRVDGAPVTADAKGRFEAQPGTREVEVTAPDHEPWRRRVRVARGQVIRVEVELQSSSARQRARTVGVLSVSGAAVLAGVGVASAILSGRASERATDWWEIETSRPPPDVLPLEESTRLHPLRTRDDIEAERDRASRWALVSNVAYGVGAVSLAVGVYFLIDQRSDERPGTPAPYAIAPVIGPGEIGVTVAKAVDW